MLYSKSGSGEVRPWFAVEKISCWDKQWISTACFCYSVDIMFFPCLSQLLAHAISILSHAVFKSLVDIWNNAFIVLIDYTILLPTICISMYRVSELFSTFSCAVVCRLMVKHYTSCEIASCLASSVSHSLCLQVPLPFIIRHHRQSSGWLHGTVLERRCLTGELSLPCARPAADGWPLMWVNHPL